MSYVAKTLSEGEVVVHIAKLHWINFLGSIALAASCAALCIAGAFSTNQGVVEMCYLAASVAALFAGISFVRQLIEVVTTEVVVTNRRVVYKVGLIRRYTNEMNTNRVESVGVSQSVLGRLLGYGTVTVRGTGAGLEGIDRLASPLSVRNALSACD